MADLLSHTVSTHSIVLFFSLIQHLCMLHLYIRKVVLYITFQSDITKRNPEVIRCTYMTMYLTAVDLREWCDNLNFVSCMQRTE